ncbi:MAG TPA: matrixin family metalloprotease [Methanothrix sp.]|nr:matrixin family metalloprotease [Methanothrix sp.]
MTDILLRMTINCVIVLCIIAAPALSLSISFCSAKGGVSSSFLESFDLDASTLLQEDITLDCGQISLDRKVEGTGKNSLKQSISGNSYALNNDIESQGRLSVSTSATTLPQEACLSQDVAGAGSISLALSGAQGSREAGQEARVSNGAIGSVQDLSVREGVFASQSTQMSGLEGCVGMGVFSDERALVATGSFLGLGTMSASLSSESKGTANAVASVYVDGKQWLDDGDLENVNRNGVVMSLEGLRADQTGNLGTFNMQAAGMNRADYDAEFGQSRPAPRAKSASTDAFPQDGITSTVLYLNDPSAYLLKSWKWTMEDPQIMLILKNDAILASKGLGADATKNAIAAAADTWDYAVARNLFADGNALVTLDPGANVDTYDNKNVHAWASISGGLAYARTYSYSGMVIESDVVYNSNVNWATNGVNNYDVQAVATHELGHTIGLADLYGIAQFDSDRDEIMHYYAGPRHSLGPGDRAGVQALYGPSGPLYGMSAPYKKV